MMCCSFNFTKTRLLENSLSSPHPFPSHHQSPTTMAFSSSTLSPHSSTNYPLILSRSPLSSLPKTTTATFLTTSSSFRPLPFHNTTTTIQCVDKASSLDPKTGVAVYKPKSYEVLVTDAANSLAYALEDGKTRLEIDFP